MDADSPDPLRRHPPSDPLEAIDPRHLRACLGSFATGVTIVTARKEDGSDVGLTINSFNALSLDPALVLWSLGRRARSLPTFLAARHYAISVLAADQIELATRFARISTDRFAGVKLHRGHDGLPLFDGALAWFECDAHSRHRYGDHMLFIGQVRRCTHMPGKALVFQQGDFHGLTDLDRER